MEFQLGNPRKCVACFTCSPIITIINIIFSITIYYYYYFYLTLFAY